MFPASVPVSKWLLGLCHRHPCVLLAAQREFCPSCFNRPLVNDVFSAFGFLQKCNKYHLLPQFRSGFSNCFVNETTRAGWISHHRRGTLE
jgi:hypothetical protein